MNITHAKQGYIMILTILVVALATVLVTYMINRGTVYVPLTKTVIDREKAKELAFAGLQMALSQLAYADVVEKEEKKDEQKQPPPAPAAGQPQQPPSPQKSPQEAAGRQLLKQLLPVMNRWQTFKLDSKKDGIDGEINMCLMSESGKLNINELYNFEKHEWIGSKKQQEELKVLLKSMFDAIAKEMKGIQGNLFDAFEKFLKDRNDKLRDVTELITMKEFEPFKNYIFYTPTQGEQAPNKKHLYLTDLFTIWSQTPVMNPWFFSSSICTILGLEMPKKIPEETLKAFKIFYSWPQDWDKIFSKFYKKDYKALPKSFQLILAATFGPETFSVLSYGTVGDITHRLFAILERDTQNRQDKAPAKVTIKKIYWI